MIDYQRIVEFLRDFRGTPGQAVTDEVRRYASEYAECCTLANQRLRQCSLFLQQGLRSEAVHLANQSPNLLEQVAALDLPEPAAWEEFCQQNDLPIPPPLQIERAAQLNEAYGQEQPLDSLLQRHRRLALARAPIRDRLETIRQLASTDTAGTFWDKDIRLFEKARMKELKIAFSEAMDEHDARAVMELSGEVLRTPWLEPITPELLTAARGADDRLKILSANAKLREILAKLRAAFAAKDHATCTLLIQEIRQLVADANQPGVSVETAADLKPILSWLKQEDQLIARRQELRAATQRLSDALEMGASDGELESLYEKLNKFDEPLPAELEERYQREMAQRLTAGRRKHRMQLAVMIVVALALFGGGYWYLRSSLAVDWTRRIHQANLNHDLSMARQLIQEQERRAPQFNDMPELVVVKQETTTLETQYNQDRQSLLRLVGALEKEQKAGAEVANAKDARIEDLLAAAERADQSAQRGRDGSRWASVDTDHQLPAVVKNLGLLATQLREAADREALVQVDALHKRLDGVAGPTTRGAQDSLASVDAIGADVESLRRLGGLGKEASDAISALVNQLAERRAALGKGLDQAQQLVAIRRGATSVEAWKKVLDAFIARFPDAPPSHDFTQAADSTEGAASIEALRALVDDWSGQFAVVSETGARERLEKIKAYVKAHPRSPYRPAVDRYSTYLEQAAEAMAVKSTWRTGFHELLSSPMIAELKYMAASDGARYYVLGDIKQKAQRLNERVFVTFEAIDPANIARRKTITITPPVTLVNDKPLLVPHAKFAESLAAQLKEIEPDNWDSFGITLIDQLMRDKEMDPVIRAVLLQQALKTTVQVSGWGVGNLYEPAMRDLARQEVENIPWFDPGHPVPDVTIKALQRIVDSLPKTEVAIQTLRENRGKMFNAVACRFSTTGALLRDENGNWAVYSSGAPEPGSTAFAAGPLPDGSDQPAVLLRVAKYEDGKFTVDESAVHDLPQGTLVFIGK